jgi:hypothetical protein
MTQSGQDGWPGRRVTGAGAGALPDMQGGSQHCCVRCLQLSALTDVDNTGLRWQRKITTAVFPDCFHAPMD